MSAIRFAGAPLVISPWWIAVIAVIGAAAWQSFAPALTGRPGAALALAISYPLALLASVVVHELAHAYLGRALGQPPTVIAVHLLGGHTQFSRAATTPGRQAAVAGIGPLTNVAVGLLCMAWTTVLPGDHVAHHVVATTAWINFAVAAFNALPGLPLDGGQVLAAAIWGLTGRKRAGVRVAAGAGLATGGVLVVLAVMWLVAGRDMITAAWTGIIGATITSSAYTVWRSEALRARVAHVTMGELAEPARSIDVEESVSALGQYDNAPVVVTSQGYVIGFVAPEAHAACPPERWSSTTVAAIMTTCPAHHPFAPTAILGEVIGKIGEVGGDRWAVGHGAGAIEGVVPAEAVNTAFGR